MSSTPAPDRLTGVTARLRAAGCVFAEDEARLLLDAATTRENLTAMVDRRVTGVPLEHVLGWVRFRGLRVLVEPGVFVPRRRTELLVETARDAGAAGAAGNAGRATIVADLCCGAGAVGAALAAELPGIELHATDIDPVAVRCARRNLADLPAGTAHVYQGDLDQPLPATLRGRVDLLVANTPYVPTESIGLMPPEAREHEPRTALDGGADGLDLHRRLAAAARRWLAPDGRLFVETSARQAAGTAACVSAAGLVPRIVHATERDATVVAGTRGAGPV